MRVLHEGLGDPKYRPCPLLAKYVEAGWLGRKSGRGFYDYSVDPPQPARRGERASGEDGCKARPAPDSGSGNNGEVSVMSTLLERAQRQDVCEGGRPQTIEAAPSAYGYPLLIKQLLLTPLRHAPDQEIVYRDLVRYDYRTLAQRIGRLANGLASLGVGPGDTVGVLDWDSHRYLECYFAIPGMGAVLHTVNIRLSPEQILYTINHAEDDVLLVHADFLPIVEGIRDRIERVKKIVVLTDGGEVPKTSLRDRGRVRRAARRRPRRTTSFPTSTRTPAPRSSTPPARPACRRACTSATASWCCTRLPPPWRWAIRPCRAGFHRADVYMPITPMFHVHAWGLPFIATMLGVKQVYPGRYAPEHAARS